MSASMGQLALTALLCTPALGALLLAAIPRYRLAAAVNVSVCALTLASAAALYRHRPQASLYLLVDGLNTVFLVVGALVGFSTSVFSAGYIAHELQTRRLKVQDLRFYHAMYQLLMFAMNLALVSNNIGLMWVAIELATLTTVMMVGIYRSKEALEAAWKYFILGSVGIALALFGTILVYLAAQEHLGQGMVAMAWDRLAASSASFDPSLLNLAFVFLLLGYGTKVGLVPVHAWLPDAHAEGPTPISALFAGFMLYRRRDIKRMFAYSSIEHMGIITLAFGLGGPLASFAGLLHMTMHSLTKSAIFFGVGYISQLEGTQRTADIRGLTSSQPLLGWLLVLSVVAIGGLPPFGVFTSEFLLVTSTFARAPWLALALVVGLLIAFSALALRLHGLAFGATDKQHSLPAWRLAPMTLHLLLVAAAGVYLPGPVVAWFRHVASQLG